MEFVTFLEEHSEALTVAFAAMVTIATLVYALLTWKLVSETRQLRKVQTDPRIQIEIDSLDIALHIVRLQITNIGQGPALNITFVPKVLEGGESADSLLSEFINLNFFETGISYLGPGGVRHSGFTQMTEDHDGKLNSKLAFDLKYKSATGHKITDTIIIDMTEYKGTYRLGTPHLYSIAQSMQKIERALGKIASGQGRIKTDIYTAKERNGEHEEAKKRYEDHRNKRGDS